MVSREYQKVQTYTGSILQNMADAVITTDSEGKMTGIESWIRLPLC
jgi:signal transduction histidine kinase